MNKLLKNLILRTYLVIPTLLTFFFARISTIEEFHGFCDFFQNIKFTIWAFTRQQLLGYDSTASIADMNRSWSAIEVKEASQNLKQIFLNNSSQLLLDETVWALCQKDSRYGICRASRLYASWKDGRNFLIMINNIINYPGPTLLICENENGDVFGGVNFEMWKEHGDDFFGTQQNVILSLKPQLNIIQYAGPESNYVYLNTKLKRQVKGIGFGGTNTCFRLFINAEMMDCYVSSMDKTYGKGDLFPSNESEEKVRKTFQPIRIEVWGFGGPQAAEKQAQMNGLIEQIKKDNRTVNKAALLENEFDKEYLLGQTFKKQERHRQS